MRATTVSSVTPWPPSTCTQRSAMRHVRFGHDHLRAARFVQRELAAVEHPRAVPDRETRDVQVHLVVGEHEADAFVIADALAERVPSPRVVDGDVVRAPHGAEPAHAMREPRGRQAHLRVAKALAHFAEDRIGRHAQPIEAHDAMAAGEALVERVHRCARPRCPPHSCRTGTSSRRRRRLRHDDREGRAVGAGDEPLAAIDHVVVAVAASRSTSASTDRSRRPAAARSCRSTSGSRPRRADAASAPSARAWRRPRAGACCLRRARTR